MRVLGEAVGDVSSGLAGLHVQTVPLGEDPFLGMRVTRAGTYHKVAQAFHQIA